MGPNKVLIVRDRRTGQPIQIPTSSIPREIQPDNWMENPDWRYRIDKGDLEPIIKRYFSNKDLEPQAISKLAQYIVDYACHIAVMGYLFGGPDHDISFNVECITKLRALRYRARSNQDIREMIHVGMDYALDPF